MNNLYMTRLIATWAIAGLFGSSFAVSKYDSHVFSEPTIKVGGPRINSDPATYAQAISKVSALLATQYGYIPAVQNGAYLLENHGLLPPHSRFIYAPVGPKVASPITYAPTISKAVPPFSYTPTIANVASPIHSAYAPIDQSAHSVTITHAVSPTYTRVVPPLVYASKKTYANAVRALTKNVGRRNTFSSPPASYDDSTTNAFVTPVTKIGTATTGYTKYHH